MNFYGSELWYKARDNTDKLSITIMPTSIESFTKLLENNELCYYGFDNGKIGKISVNKTDIDLLKTLVGEELAAVMKIEEISKPYTPPEKNVFGTVEYKYIAKKTRQFLTGESEAEQKAIFRTAELLKRDGIKFSGRAYGDKVTLTLNGQDMEKATAYYKNALDHIEKLPDQIEQDRVSNNIEAVIDKMIDLGFTDEQLQNDYSAIIRELSAFSDVDIEDYLIHFKADFTAEQNQELFVLLKEVYENGGFDLISPSKAQDKLYELEKEYKVDVLLREYFDLHSFNSEQKAAVKEISVGNETLPPEIKYINETFSPAEITKLHELWQNNEQETSDKLSGIERFISEQHQGKTGIGYTDSFNEPGNGTVLWTHLSYDDEKGESFRIYTVTYKEILLAKSLFDNDDDMLDYISKTATSYETKTLSSDVLLSYRVGFTKGEMHTAGDAAFFDRVAQDQSRNMDIFTLDDMAAYIAKNVDGRISEDQLRQLIEGKTDELLSHGGIDERLPGYSRSDVLLFCSELKSSPFAKKISSNLTEKVKSELSRKGIDVVKEKSFAEQVDEVLSGKANRYNDLKVCDTPQVLLDIGCKQLPMFYTQRHLKAAIEPKSRKLHHHGLTTEFIKQIPVIITEPAIIMDSLTRDDSLILILPSVDAINNPIIVSVKPDGKGTYELVTQDSNYITSIYGREDFVRFLNAHISNDNVLYVNQEKSQELFSVLGLEFPKGLNSLDFVNPIIHKSRNIVNSEIDEEKGQDTLRVPELQSSQGVSDLDHSSIVADKAEPVNSEKEDNTSLSHEDSTSVPMDTKLDVDVFFHNPDTGRIDEIYYNPDGNDGNGQYVTVSFGYDLIADADAHSNTPDEFFDYLSMHGETVLDDRGTGGFSGVEKLLAEEGALFRDCTEETMDGLVALSEKELNKDKEQEKTIPPKELKPIYIERNGDFFEAYGKSARKAAQILDLTIVQSERGDKVGFPDSKRQEYDRLLNTSGYETVFEDAIDRSIRYINKFCEIVYQQQGNFSNLDHVELFGRKRYSDEIPMSIEIYADLESWRIVTEHNGRIVNEKLFSTPEEMADNLELFNLNDYLYLDKQQIEVGDRYEYLGKEYTVVSLEGDHPDEVKVSYTETYTHNFSKEEIISNMYIDTLLNESVYLGKAAELDRENDTVEKDEDDLLSDIDLGHISDKRDTSWIDQLEKVVEQAEADFEKNYGTDTKPQPSKQTKQSRRKNAVVSNVWSDFEYFNGDGQKYGIAEIDRLMKLYDDEVTDRKRSFSETGDFYPTYTMEFTINLPDGHVIEENRELGNGVGGLIDFLKSQGDTYSDIIPQLEEQIERENKKPQRSTKRMEQQENDLRQLTLSFDEPPIDAERSDEKTEQTDKPKFQNGESDVSETKAAENNTPLPEKEKVDVSNNYRITDEHIGEGTKSERFKNNIEAIKVLKVIESENRLATPEEQEILAKYVGWGGLSECFVDRHHANAELRHDLTDEEYAAARESTMTAFYTPPIVMQSIYKKLGEMGFEGGRVLEPSCGVGNFIGTMPEDMQRRSDVHAVELDSISGRIAQKLYPAADVQVKGFEKTHFSDNSFDVAVGNVPFGDISVRDKQYDKYNWRIHNYFFGKSLDKVRPGGVVAFLTSRYTLDSKNSAFRQYLAERADLLGAVRLPTGTFSKAAGTEVVSDIIFLQKRDEIGMPEIVPEWVQTTQTDDGFSINNYFDKNPEMVLGEIQSGKGMHGRPEMIVKIIEDEPLGKQIEKAMHHIDGTIPERTAAQSKEEIEVHFQNEAAAPENLRNYSLFVQDDKVYFKKDDKAALWAKGTKSGTTVERAKAFIGLRDITRALLDAMVNDCSDAQLKALQQELSKRYDDFKDNYGIIHSRYNRSLFGDDISYQLVAALENKYDEKAQTVEKSDLFTKRTIRPPVRVTSVDTAQEALAISMAECGRVDLNFMSELYDVDKDTIINELKGQIFPVPELSTESEIVYQEQSEYLSGDIRQKLNAAESAAQNNPQLYSANINALKDVMPELLKAGDIDAKIGAAWIDPKYYEQFMYETFKTPMLNRQDMSYRIYDTIELSYSSATNAYSISHKSNDKSVFSTKTFGMDIRGANAYDIFENLLNFRDTKIYMSVKDGEGNEKRVVDPEKTKLAANKAKKIQEAFSEWIFKNPERREYLVNKYNEIYNSIRPREYDGSALTFPGMNAEITLRKHQKDAIAHAIYGGNTLFDHSVGAGKTFEMIASVMERKRLGISNKALMVVPNHLTEQIGDDFQKLYPNANILVATKSDFSKENRRALISKIATGDYDAVIIGHTQLGMIPLSKDTQEKYLQEEVDQLTSAIAEMKKIDGKSFGVKEAEKRKKNLQKQLDELQTKKDDIVTFEELGVDTLVLDEAHEFKNLHTPTNMQNVSGIGSAASKKASDLYMKCQYLNEKTGNKGLIFATGTPISNSVTELFTMQRYLQNDVLKAKRISHFDQWIGMFGHKVTDYQIDPTGKKFKLKTRISKYTNMTELMSMFKSVADIKTADMMKLDVPECETNIVNVEPTQLQQELVDELAFRADKVENGSVDPTVDNFLKITSDGRKVGLDPRLIDSDLEDNPNTKLNKCVENVFQIYQDTAPEKLTQLIFCDLGVPNSKNSSKAQVNDEEVSVTEKESFEDSGNFCIYDDIKSKLIAKGVNPDEIAFIHDAKTEDQKAQLFEKVRNGEVRVLIGSTPKMGTGTNIQTRLAALHDLDVPWRPADLEQRLGRMVRQGNMNKNVKLFRYVTKGTFDAYSYQTLENKQRYIAQLYTGNSRTCEDVDQQSLSYSEIKTLCTGDERLKEVMQLDNDIANLSALKRDHTNTVYEMQDKLKLFQKDKAKIEQGIKGVQKDIEICSKLPKDKETGGIAFEIKIDGITYTDKTEAAKQLERVFKRAQGELVHGDEVKLATMYGFDVKVKFSQAWEDFSATVSGNANYSMRFSEGSHPTNIKRLMNIFDGMEQNLQNRQDILARQTAEAQEAQTIANTPFPKEVELAEKIERRDTLKTALQAEQAVKAAEGKDKPQTFHFSIAELKRNSKKVAQSKPPDKPQHGASAIE